MTTISGDDDSYDEISKGWYKIWESKIWRNAAGKFHRDGDLPAIIYDDGSMSYYKDGKLHRDGGLPAVIYGGDGYVEYWIEGVRQK